MNFPHLESAERTDTGRRRRNNEDAVLRLSEHGLFCVADGMGGAAAGELASQAAVNTLRRGFLELPVEAPAYPGLNTRIRLSSHLLDEASRWIRGRGRGDGGFRDRDDGDCSVVRCLAAQPGGLPACPATAVFTSIATVAFGR